MLRRELLLSSSESSDDEIEIRVYKQRVNFHNLNLFEFKECFRITPTQADYILEKIGPMLEPRTKRSLALSAKEQLLLCLHWIGNGAQQHGIASMHGISKSTVCRTVNKVINIIINVMFQNTVCWPQEAHGIATQFLLKGGFPSVCGCVDGTLINIDAPSVHEEVYVDRHGNHSLNVMVISEPEYTFYSANANWPGSVHDSRVLRNTVISGHFEAGWRPFPGAVILGDSAYGLKEWLIPPLNRNPDNVVEQRFNRAHKMTRRIVENSIGILKERFPCLNHLRLKPRKAAKVVLACITLHNIACKIGIQNDDVLTSREEEEHNNGNAEEGEVPNVGAVEKLNSLLEYFTY